jgi:hypothetical protein
MRIGDTLTVETVRGRLSWDYLYTTLGFALTPLRRVSIMLHPPGTVVPCDEPAGEERCRHAPNPSPASDEQVRALLERYECRVPFHEVRTRFLGNIASPVMSASPIKVVKDLWGGELPPFDTIDEANELIGALVMGLWNRLTRHQDRRSAFHLVRLDAAARARDWRA